MMGMALFFRYRRLFPTLLAMASSDSKSTHACRMAVCNSLDDNLLRLSLSGELATLLGNITSNITSNITRNITSNITSNIPGEFPLPEFFVDSVVRAAADSLGNKVSVIA